MVKVKNLNDIGGRKVPKGYDSWLDWWMDQKGKTATPDCANQDCSRKATLGGHVKKVNSDDNSWYMVPLCHGCNQLKDSFEVNASDMAPINP